MSGHPVTNQEFAALMAPLGPYGPDRVTSPIMVAVSGGADSMALAFLARQWRHHVIALVVDHALRSGSAEEARITCERLAALDIPSRLLTLGPLKPGGMQERARDARFDILEHACVEEGGHVLLVAHHEADQEETLMMRHQRASGILGMGGMARRGVRGRIAVVRPLLGIRPERLRATLNTAHILWCEDPSNQKRCYQRVRLRQDMTSSERQLMHRLRHNAINEQCVRDEKMTRCLAWSSRWHPEGWVTLYPHAMAEESDMVQNALLARLIRLLGGGRYLPRASAVQALRQRGYGSLGGTRLRQIVGASTRWILMREERGIEAPLPARYGQRWDGRWRYLGDDAPYYSIAALGKKAECYRVGREVPAAVLRTLPALWSGDELIAVVDGARGVHHAVPRCAFVWDSGVPVTGERSVL